MSHIKEMLKIFDLEKGKPIFGLSHNAAEKTYNEGKRFAESTVMTYYNFFKLNTHIARIFNTYGTNMLQHSGRQIPDFIQSAASGDDIEIAGDKNTMSSFCDVKDIIQGLVKLMDSDVIDPVNLGDPNPRTLTEVAGKIINLTSSKSKIVYSKGYDFSMKPAIPNIDKAKENLDWIPLISLDAGLTKDQKSVLLRKVEEDNFNNKLIILFV